MVVDSIRTFNHATPFQPCEIRMTSGETHRVPQPDFALISPKGSHVIVVDSKERPHHLNSYLIEEAVPVGKHSRRKIRKGAS